MNQIQLQLLIAADAAVMVTRQIDACKDSLMQIRGLTNSIIRNKKTQPEDRDIAIELMAKVECILRVISSPQTSNDFLPLNMN